MDITDSLTDEAILTELGRRVAARRLELELTQADAADQAGISKRTLERIEAGQTSQLTSFIRVLRVLGAASGLDQVLPEAAPSPIDLLHRRGKIRQRAPRQRTSKVADQPWSWGEDT